MNAKVIFITGAAKRIGAYTAKYLHQLGWNIVLHYNQSEQLAKQLCSELNAGREHSVKLVQGKLDTIADAELVAQQALKAYGRLDGLINNASSFYPTPIGSISGDDWTNLVGSNMQAPLFLAQQCYPMLKQHKGVIINMVDIHAQQPLKNHTLYCMAKSALLTMTKSLALELAPDVRVNGIAPGAILWPESALNEQDKHVILGQIPLQQLGSMRDIAQAIHFLLNAPYITGQIIAVDGGRSIASHAIA